MHTQKSGCFGFMWKNLVWWSREIRWEAYRVSVSAPVKDALWVEIRCRQKRRERKTRAHHTAEGESCSQWKLKRRARWRAEEPRRTVGLSFRRDTKIILTGRRKKKYEQTV